MGIPAFANAKNLKEARAAVQTEIEKGNNSLFGEAPLREEFSTFELELAAMYKGLKDQKTLAGLLNRYFDAVQGDKATNRQLELGEEPREAISKEDAIKEVFGSYDTKPAETQRQVDEGNKEIATKITQQLGKDLVATDEKEVKEAYCDGSDAREMRSDETKKPSDETVSTPKDGGRDSVVSPKADTKVQQKLDKTKSVYQKAPTNSTRGFITDVSKALGLTQHGVSQYGTFDLPTGDKVTIRISNHNARVSRFDENGEDNAISIVISRYRDKGALNDGNAHVVEVFYNKKAIEQAKGKPLADIIESIKEAITTGEYSDKTGLGKIREYNSKRRELRGKNGEVYGFVLNGKIYLDVKKMRPETPLHEYTHLWTEALKSKNPEEWENVKKLFDEVEGLKEEVQKLYPELKGDDLYDEMIATYSGREGTKKLEATTRELAAKDGKTVSESAKSQSFIEKVKTALQKYWEGVADMLHIHFTNAEEVADKVLADWAKGVKPGEEKAVETGTHEDTPQWHDVKIGLFTIHADKDMTERADKVWNDVKKYLGENPEATVGDIQRKFKIGANLASFVHAHWNEQNKMPLLPKNEKIDPETDPVAAAAEDFKKEHPMTEDEMRRYLTSKNSNSYDDGGVRFRMELGKTFSDSKEDFDGVRDRAVEEKGIVMPNLNKESVKVVSVEKHRFGETEKDIISNAKSWAKENLVTTGKTELPTMHDGTTYTISKAAIDKYLSESAVKKSESLDTHISVLPKLKEVIHESIEAEIHPDYIKAEDGNRSVENGYGNNVLVHRLYGAVQLDGRTYRVKTTMQEFMGGEENKPHSYEVTKIELLDSPGERENPDRPHSDAPNNSISAAKLLNEVEKSYDKGKKLLDESKDLADGETRFRKGESEDATGGEPTPREKEQQEQMEEHRATVLKATEKLNT